MEKLDMQTANIADKNFEALSKLFPNAVTETIDENGEVVRAIDADVLRQEISCSVVEGKDERYQFTWPDKKKAIVSTNSSVNETLRPFQEESVNFDNTENIYIEGDNLDVLKVLQETYLGKIKIIYIDPPYNTGSDSFVYADNLSMSSEEFSQMSGQRDEDGNLMFDLRINNESSGRFHTDWLNMMYSRIKLARNLLTEDGLIFISINEIEQVNLEKLCNEIFGAENHVTTFVWKNKYGPGAFTKGVASLHEFILCYGKNYPSNIEAKLSEEEMQKYKMTDENVSVRGGYITQPLATRSKDDRPNLVYPLIHNGIEIWPDKQWIWEKSRLYEAYENGEVVINEKDGKYSVRFKQYLKDKNGNVRKGKPLSLLTFCFNQDGTKEMEELLGHGVFGFPKPTALIQYFLSLRINETDDNDYYVMDFFSGSASTADAVMRVNAEDGGKRKYIMVQLQEKTKEDSVARKEGYENICEIGKERIRRAGKKIKEETGADIDYGFRVLKLDTSNMKDVYYRPADTDQTLLDMFTDNIKPDRTPEDLLFQVMLDLGVLLSSKIEEIEIAGKKVFNVADGFLIACFDKDVTDETIKAVANMKPYYAVFRDNSMKNDSVATNFDQIFANISPDTIRMVL